MPCFLKFFFFLVPIWAVIGPSSCDGGRIFSFEMHHRYSDQVKNWSISSGKLSHSDWPDKGSFDYYALLAQRDQILRGRHLSDTDTNSPLIFSDGNSTVRISSLGLYVTSFFFTKYLRLMPLFDFLVIFWFFWILDVVGGFLFFIFYNFAVCIIRRCNWGRREWSLWWRLIREVICFGCRVNVANVRLLRALLMLLYVLFLPYIYIFPCKLLFDSKGFPFAHFVLTCLRCIVESASQKSAMKKALWSDFLKRF